MFESLAEKLKRMKHAEETDVTFKDYEETVSAKATAEPEVVAEPKKTATVSGAGEGESNIELKVVRPSSFDEVGEIADFLLAGCTVVLNLEILDGPSIIRMLDFLNGVTYSTDGEIKNVSKSTYIITPHNVDVSDK